MILLCQLMISQIVPQHSSRGRVFPEPFPGGIMEALTCREEGFYSLFGHHLQGGSQTMLHLLIQMWPLRPLAAEAWHGRWLHWASPVTLTIARCQVSWRTLLAFFEQKTLQKTRSKQVPLALSWSPWVPQDITFPRTLTRGKSNLS